MTVTDSSPALASAGIEPRIAAVRRFSRFYTGIIGALQEGLLRSDFSLTEARVLYELANRPGITASALGRDLGLDAGYLSRILQRFTQDGLLVRTVSDADRRQSVLALTDAGRAAFAPLDARSREEVGALLARLPAATQDAIVTAMGRIETLLGAAPAAAWRTRAPGPGDIGWVVSRHGALYAEEYGFDSRFEALVAQVAGAWLAGHDPVRERCWIAEHDGVPLGSVFLVRADDELAKLRLLLVEPSARGLGIGKRLVSECIDFARAAGYRRMTLWTNDILVAARAIYQAAGFRLVASEPHNKFGPAMVGEDWELNL
ncbi:MAG TPA: bifunctional helix-turn-helix transcriptional regulator/GNAT family N-acetyltransferase [Acetobacteraceae bacterium]|jgi:DNA-binding MarR family transcriptional regulator/predicted GNAT family acetyltransferase|nr:bifunctional helix-turn-helix transcriptional regulator/GNAT family N-acetyltransferase [Acetobacteraceae bacterium]